MAAGMGYKGVSESAGNSLSFGLGSSYLGGVQFVKIVNL